MLDDEDQVRAALTKLEGAKGFDYPVDSASSLSTTIKLLHKQLADYPDRQDSLELSAGEVYGSGGKRRYFLSYNGRINYSCMHGSDEAPWAKILGFRLFNN